MRGAKTSPVPADDGFRRDQDEGLLPSRPDPPSNHPSELIEKPETRARMSTFQRDELLTQSEILEKETLPSAKERTSIPKKSQTKRNMIRIHNKTVVR